MKLTLASSLLASAALLMVGCAKNPAENVNEANVNEASGTKPPAAPAADAAALDIDADGSTIGFVGSKVTGSHDGGFKSFSGLLAVKDGKLVAPGSTVEIDMTSTWSDNEKLTGHLKSPDFFDVEKYPTATFTFTSVEAGEGNAVKVTGDLAFHGVTKSVTFDAEVEASDEAASLKAEFFIKRFDFNIKYPGKTDDLIRDEVVIKLDVKAGA